MNWSRSFRTKSIKKGVLETLRLSVLRHYYRVRLSFIYNSFPFLAKLKFKRVDDYRHEVFATAFFGMMGKMAVADRGSSSNESLVFDRFVSKELSLKAKQKILAYQIYTEAKTSATSFQEYVEAFKEEFVNSPAILECCLELLMAIAYADNQKESIEKEYLMLAAKIFNISQGDYKRIKDHYLRIRHIEDSIYKLEREARFKDIDDGFESTGSFKSASDLKASNVKHDWAYSALGCSKTDSIDEIKQSYRKLVKKYHPDTLVSQGVPEEFIKQSQESFREIQEAFELLEVVHKTSPQATQDSYFS